MSQRKRLFLLVFVWSCLCLVIFKSLFLSGPGVENQQLLNGGEPPPPLKLRAREASSERPADTAAILIDNSPISEHNNQQNDAYFYQVHEANNKSIVSKISSTSTSASTSTSQKPQRSSTKMQQAGSQCSYDYPNVYDLQFNNIYWQRLTTWSKASANITSPAAANHGDPLRATYYLYNAYYDDRWRAGAPSVRILAMIDRVKPPPTNCLLWYSQTPAAGHKPRAVVTRASFVYAWYPKWGNYEDGLLQPWIVTCPVPHEQRPLVPDSVSLVGVPGELEAPSRKRRSYDAIAMPPQFSSSSSSSSASPQDNSAAEQSPISGASSTTPSAAGGAGDTTQPMRTIEYDCKSVQAVTNNLVVTNRRPPAGQARDKFAVCVKGLDFPHDDVSVRLVEWIELLHLLGAKKIFLYELSVHENVSKVLKYYQQRGMVELSPLTLPGDQPNLPEFQHLYLKQKLTSKRQNELIPYNDCLYRNLHSFEYLALLDIDEIIMPLRSEFNELEQLTNWYDLMAQVEFMSLAEQNYSRASYNVRNVYFFDDLSGPLGTTQSTGDRNGAPASEPEAAEASSSSSSLERGVPHYLHMMSHVYRSKNYTEPGQYVKCFHNTDRVVSLHNHFPMNCFGQCTTFSIPVNMAHLQHYRKDCVGPLRQSCKNDFRHFTTRDTTIWRYKQRMIRRTTRVLNHLGLLTSSGARVGGGASTQMVPADERLPENSRR